MAGQSSGDRSQRATHSPDVAKERESVPTNNDLAPGGPGEYRLSEMTIESYAKVTGVSAKVVRQAK